MPTIDLSTTPAGTVLALSGEFGMLESGELNDALASAMRLPPQVFVVDLSRVTMLASCGMGALVAFRRGVSKAGGVVRLAAVGRLVLEAMKRAALQKLFEFYDTVDLALAAPRTTASPSNV